MENAHFENYILILIKYKSLMSLYQCSDHYLVNLENLNISGYSDDQTMYSHTSLSIVESVE